MTPALAVAVLGAGAVGAVLRWLVSRGLGALELKARAISGPRRDASADGRPGRWLSGVPVAVLVVNTLGSALAGAILGLAEAGAVSADLRLILLAGFCGGLTTFSTFSVETIQLVIDGRWRTAITSVGANLLLGIGAAALAYLITR